MVRMKEAEQILQALKQNKTIQRFNLDHNPVKQSLLESIELICIRNMSLNAAKNKSDLVDNSALKRIRLPNEQAMKREIQRLKGSIDKMMTSTI